MYLQKKKMTPRPTPFTHVTLPILPGREETLHRQKQRDELEDEKRQTTFTEYIEYCHDYLYKPLQINTYEILQPIVQSDEQLKKRDLTLCPTYLRPWQNFEQLQTHAYKEVLETLGSREMFPPRNAMRDDGLQLCDGQVQTENDLLLHQKYAVENQTELVIRALKWLTRNGSSALSSFDVNLQGRILFEHRSDDRSPQVCAVRKAKGNPLLFYIQGNHRLTPENLRVGLRQGYLWDKVVRRSKDPTDMNERLVYHAEYMTATALAQIYDAMMHRGMSYGILATGSCLVFLHVAEDNPETLYYFLSEPTLDVQTMVRRGHTNWMKKPVTAIGRILALYLMSTTQPIRGLNWQSHVLPSLHKLGYDFNWVFTHIPPEELVYAPPASEYKPPVLRDAPSSQETLAARLPRPAPTEIPFEFCTAQCLLGLQRKGEIDQNCPNVRFHQAQLGLTHHPIDSADMVRMLTSQLEKNMEQYCHVIDPQRTDDFGEAWGIIFKITLVPFGYTVAAKGSLEKGWEEGLRQEEEIYRTLQPVQGHYVPVFLGSIHPNRPYVIERQWINHFLLLSWGGQALDTIDLVKDHFPEYREAMRNIRACGVDMGVPSIPHSNLLWSEDQRSLQVIGFRKAKVVEEWRELGKRKERGNEEGPAKRQRSRFI